MLPEKLDRCVSDVKAKGGVDNPWAVCNASLNKGTQEVTKPNQNRQVPFFNPPIKKGKIEPDIKKKLTGSGEKRLNQDSVLWKNIFDSQLRRNVKEPKI